MATGQTMHKLRSEFALRLYKFDPDATSVTAVAWVDMRDYENFMASICRTIGTDDVTFDIAASASSDGSSPVVVKAHAVGDQPDAEDDQLHLEISAEQLAALSTANLRYVSARISVATNTDEMAVTYIRAHPRYAKRNLTTDIVA